MSSAGSFTSPLLRADDAPARDPTGALMRIVATAVALGAIETGGPLSPAETALVLSA